MSGLLQPTDRDWLALCLVTESNRPEEWPCIAQVIENRLASGRWGKTLTEVILAPKQFSAFNGITEIPKEHYRLDCAFPGLARHQDVLLLMHAVAFVLAPWLPGIQGRGKWALAITNETLHYYSPISMVPKGSKPAWAASAKRLYTPAGIDPERFVFAEGVP